MPNNNPTGRNQYTNKTGTGGPRRTEQEHPARALGGAPPQERGDQRERSSGQHGSDKDSRGKH